MGSRVIPINQARNTPAPTKHPARRLTKESIEALPHESKAYEVRDTVQTGLIVRVQPAPSKRKSYVLQYGRGKRITICRTDEVTPTKARKIAKKLAGEVAGGADLQEDKKAKKRAEREAKAAARAERRKAESVITLSDYLDGPYKSWLIANGRKYGHLELQRLRTQFKDRLNKPLEGISHAYVEKWKLSRMKDNLAPRTINRDLAALKAAMLLICIQS